MTGISETKKQSDRGFLSNVHIPGYNIHTQATKRSAGGVALYNSTLNYKTGEDLCVTKYDFEMVCVEFLSETDKNTICCCVCRHPNTDVQEFLNLTDNLLQKVTKERKFVFFDGCMILYHDFNLNLLNYETHSDTNDFINSAISSSLLPNILHPTRVTEHSATVIDKIFSNITNCESTSGNILCQISDHSPQFITAEKCSINYKSCSFAKRDYSNFNEYDFIDDYSSLDLSRLHDDNASVDNKFNTFYKILSCQTMDKSEDY